MKIQFAAIVLIALLLGACSGAETEAPTTTPNSEPATVAPAPPAPTDQPDDYPAAPTTAPLPGYPAPSAAQLLVSRPLGLQCVGPETYAYATLDAAVSSLANAGARIVEARTTNRMVCEACTCPTSEHFEVIIVAADREIAAGLGWTIEGEE